MNRNATVDSPLIEILRSIRRHRRIAILFFFVVVGCTVAVTLLMPKEYRSTAKLFVRLGRENATLDPTVTLGQNSIVTMPQTRDSEINSVVEILQSRTLLEKVVDALGSEIVLNGRETETKPDTDAKPQMAVSWMGKAGEAGAGLLAQLSSSAGLSPRERAIIRLEKNLHVEAAKKSNVIEVSYLGKTPEQCQLIAAKLVDLYLDEHVRLNRTEGSHEFFVQQTERLHADLERREGELRDLKKETGLASPDAQRQLLVTRVGRLEDELLEADAAREVAKARLDELRTKMKRLPKKNIVSETNGYGNEGTDRMRDQFYALQLREKEAAAKFTDEHPKMKQIREQIEAAEAVLKQEERTRKQVTEAPDPLYQKAAADALAEQPILASLEAKSARLKTQLAAARKDLTALNDNELRIAALQREIDLLDADYRKYSNNLEQSRIDQELEEQRMSNIGIVQSASFEPKPIRPKKMLNLLLGIGLGGFGGLALPLAIDQYRVLTVPARRKKRLRKRDFHQDFRQPLEGAAVESRRVPR